MGGTDPDSRSVEALLSLPFRSLEDSERTDRLVRREKPLWDTQEARPIQPRPKLTHRHSRDGGREMP